MATVQGIAYWAKVQNPDITFDPMWSIDLAVDKETARGFKAKGVAIKQNEDGEYLVKFKRKVTRANGGENNPPRIVDGNKKPLLDMIGNGSEVIVQYQTYDWTYKTKKGVGTDLIAVQVLKLVEYTQKEPEVDEFEELGDTEVQDAPFDDDEF